MQHLLNKENDKKQSTKTFLKMSLFNKNYQIVLYSPCIIILRSLLTDPQPLLHSFGLYFENTISNLPFYYKRHDHPIAVGT